MSGAFPPPAPFVVSTDVEAATWIDDALQPSGRLPDGVLVGEIVPSGFEAYARVFHPARRDFGPSIGESTVLRWSEVAAARGKAVHPEMQIEDLIDSVDGHDYERWEEISVGGGKWFPPFSWLGDTEALALASLLRPRTSTPHDAWFMLWDGWGDLGRGIDGIPRGVIHRRRPGTDEPAELKEGTWALRHYLVIRGPLDALGEWFGWRDEAANYWWTSAGSNRGPHRSLMIPSEPIKYSQGSVGSLPRFSKSAAATVHERAWSVRP